MSMFLNMYKNSDSLHHAYYFVEHKIEDGVIKIKNFLEEKLNFKTSGNPDFFHKKYDNFNIDDARFVIDIESRKSVTGNKKIFIIETDFITLEAQNALLKVFEEPKKGTHFFIISPQNTILPTLRSRLLVFENESELDSSENILEMSMKDRINTIKELTDEIKDEDSSKQDAIEFVNKIIQILYKQGIENNSGKINLCERTREALFQRGAPIKMILENLVLSI